MAEASLFTAPEALNRDGFRFVVPGIPVAWSRPRFRRVGEHLQSFTAPEVVRFKDRVRLFAREAGIVISNDGALELTVVAYWPMKGTPLKRGSRPALRKTTKPDWDNIGKAVSDSLNGLAYKDDAQIVRGTVDKWHCAQDDPDGARVVVTIKRLD